jgi:hypothetical protein
LFSTAKKLARAKKNELVKIGKQRVREEGLKALPGFKDMARSQGRKYIDQARARATQSLDDAVDYGSAIGQVKRAKIGKKVTGFIKDQKIGKRLSEAIVQRALKTIAGGGSSARPRGRPRGRGRGGALRPAGY